MESLVFILLLQVKHWFADFVLQTYKQTVMKGVYGNLCGIRHSVDHVWTSFVMLVIFSLFFPISIPLLLGVVVVEGIIHYHIDWVKVKYGCKDNTKPVFWSQFGLDQLAHQLTYLGMALVLLYPIL